MTKHKPAVSFGKDQAGNHVSSTPGKISQGESSAEPESRLPGAAEPLIPSC